MITIIRQYVFVTLKLLKTILTWKHGRNSLQTHLSILISSEKHVNLGTKIRQNILSAQITDTSLFCDNKKITKCPFTFTFVRISKGESQMVILLILADKWLSKKKNVFQKLQKVVAKLECTEPKYCIKNSDPMFHNIK